MTRTHLIIKFILGFLIISNSLVGQDSDILILNNGDELKGTIRSDQNFELSQRVFFTPSGSDEVQSYKPVDLLSFCFSNKKCFESLEFENEGMTQVRNFQKSLSGPTTFYILSQKKGSRYFVTKSDGTLVELIETFEETGTTKKSNAEYKRVLISILDSDHASSKEIMDADLRTKSLKKTIMEYYVNQNIEFDEYRTKPVTVLEPTILVGVGRFLGETNKARSLRIGVDFRFSAPELKKNLSYHVGLHFRTDPYGHQGNGDIEFILPVSLGLGTGSSILAPEFYFGLAPAYVSGIDYADERFHLVQILSNLGFQWRIPINEHALVTDINLTSDVVSFSLGFGF